MMTDSSSNEIAALGQELVRIPSRAGIDDPSYIIGFIQDWLEDASLPVTLLRQEGRPVGLTTSVETDRAGPALCLDACIDTAPFGDEMAWGEPPTRGSIKDDKLWGRGSADSKIGVAILLTLAKNLSRTGLERGSLQFLFDADEHTGCFGGARAFLREAKVRPTAAVLAYPGNEKVVIGARGFLRLRIHLYGLAAHSGASRQAGTNAIERAATFVRTVTRKRLPAAYDAAFPMAPKVTITEVNGGQGYSTVPDHCICSIDIRLTPKFTGEEALSWVAACVEQTDHCSPAPTPTQIEIAETWPPYRVDRDDPLVRAFQAASVRAFDRDIPAEICGPSNIGNLFAVHDVPTICAPGVSYEALHGTDECADLADVARVYELYWQGTLSYLNEV